MRNENIGIFGAVVVAGAIALSTGTAHALSCDGRLVEVGDSEAYVRSVCGEPTLVHTRTEMRTAFVGAPYYGYAVGYAQTVPVQVDVLVYDFGPTRFVDELTFENGVLRADRIAGYGTVAAARARREARRAERSGRARDDE
jgi:hypothetical protein